MLFKGSRHWVSSWAIVVYHPAQSTLRVCFVFQYLHGLSDRSLPRLPLHMHAENVFPTFLTSTINIGLCLPKAHTQTQLRMYKLFEVLPIVWNHKAWACWEFSTSPCQETDFCTGWRVWFISRREFRSLHNPRSELHPLIFAEKCSHCRYHSTCHFHPDCYTVMVNTYSKRHSRYMQS